MTIPAMSQMLGMPVGISDHSLGIGIPVAAVALGAVAVEKHIKWYGDKTSADSKFALDPCDFEKMIIAGKQAYKGRTGVRLIGGNKYRRSIWAVQDIKSGEEFSSSNIKVLRPSGGIEPLRLKGILGTKSKCDIKANSPLLAEYLGE
jgi:N-acetylneuraminate synthase